jgi:ribosomal protein S18 acetylase RimI-like enzyme
MPYELDNPVWNALAGPQAHLALANASARRFQPDHAPFVAIPDQSPGSLAALEELISATGEGVLLSVGAFEPPGKLVCVFTTPLIQMWAPAFEAGGGAPSSKADMRPLGPQHAGQMTALVSLTEPGPFAARTHELGRYLGVIVDGQLVALAGERMNLSDYVEISAVCAHPDHRGRGYPHALVGELCRLAVARGQTPFLHLRADNHPAMKLYEQLGFKARRTLELSVLRGSPARSRSFLIEAIKHDERDRFQTFRAGSGRKTGSHFS